VNIWVNDIIVDTHVYGSQPDPSSFTYIYNVTANIGATIRVRAICSISGFREQTLTVTSGTTTTNGTIPGFIGVLIITSITTILITIIISKRIRGK